MVVVDAEFLERLVAGRIHEAKMVFNERGAIVFPVTRQHREMKLDGVSYEDDYRGNALAAMVRRDSIEIRFHQAFDDAAVARIVRNLIKTPEFSRLGQIGVTYQGRAIEV